MKKKDVEKCHAYAQRFSFFPKCKQSLGALIPCWFICTSTITFTTWQEQKEPGVDLHDNKSYLQKLKSNFNS